VGLHVGVVLSFTTREIHSNAAFPNSVVKTEQQSAANRWYPDGAFLTRFILKEG
jgi:hypothetical protein